MEVIKDVRDFVIMSNLLFTNSKAASNGSVRCCTSALTAKRISLKSQRMHDKETGRHSIQLFGFSTNGTRTSSPSSSFIFLPPNVFPKSVPPLGKGSGLGLLCFSGDKEPVGSLVLVAAASVSSPPSSALSNSGLLSLESLLRFPNMLLPLFQKPLLRLPFPSRLQAGGLNLPPETDPSTSELVSERKPE
jgi:hypothetical protein